MILNRQPGYAALALVLYAVSCPASAQSILLNGDFSSGNTGFTSQYSYNPISVHGAGEYAVSTNPYLVHAGGASFADHTTGSGLMLIANGAGAGETVWQQTVAVAQNIDYTFSGWVASWGNANGIDPSPATLLVYVNDVQIGSVLAPTQANGQWTQFGGTWNSADFSQAVIRMVDLNRDPYGNDFALDDLSFTAPIPEPSTYALMLAGLGAVVVMSKRRRVKDAQPAA